MIKTQEVAVGIPTEVKFLTDLSEFIEYYGKNLTLNDIQEILVDRIYIVQEYQDGV